MADVTLTDITTLKTVISGTSTATVSAKRQAVALNLCDLIARVTGLTAAPAAQVARATGAIYAAAVSVGLTPGADGSF